MSDPANEEIIHSINHLLDLRTSQHPDLQVVAVPNKDLTYTKYTYKQITAATAVLANYYADSGILPPRPKGDTKSKLTVAILSHSGWDFVVQELALVRMGYCVLFVSVNNAPAAISHLLAATDSTHIITHATFMSTVQEAMLQHPADRPVKIIEQVSGDLYNASAIATGKSIWVAPLTPEEEKELPAFIVHSSGSTGFPKPIFLNHRASVGNISQHFGLPGFTTLPLYHNHGHSCFYRAMHGAVPIYLFPQSLIPITTSNILTLLTSPDCDAEALYGVPYVLKLLSEDNAGLEVLRKFELVMFGGSPCPDELGDRLVTQGVNLVGHYGLTEMGQIFTSFRDFKTDKGWNWLRGSGQYVKKKQLMNWIRMDEIEAGKYELVVLDGYPTKVMSNQPDGSYSTKDVFIKHPTIPDAFKFVGRIDDTLVMVNGEKTNPVPMELTLRQSPNISEAVIFGAGRAQIGALILLAEHISPSLPREELVNLVTPALDLANSKAPTHSHLSPEALAFLPHETPLPRADKGSFLRPKVYAAFAGVIEQVYKDLEGDGDEGDKQNLRDLNDAKAIVLQNVMNALSDSPKLLENDTDLFQLGLDSLQATRIRNSLQRNIDLGGNKLSSNFVFENPSVEKMAEYLLALKSGGVAQLTTPSQTDLMLQLVDKYKHFKDGTDKEPTQSSTLNGVKHVNGFTSKVVVLTGATGSLGASLLEHLLIDQSVSMIYCLSRARDNEDARIRIVESMKNRGLSTKMDPSRLICLAVSDFGADQLGLPGATYDEMAKRVTVVIHNAWPVNFNLGITSFEPHIRGAANLIKLALIAPPSNHARFYFSSSVSAVFSWPGPGPVPESVLDDPTYAQDMGYARSKWVVEKLCQIASQTTALQAEVLRIGQMVGDSRTGIWNETEAISLIIKSAETVGALPDLDESPSWLPVDYAARCIVELISLPPHPSPSRGGQCWHVVQPKLVHWRSILTSLAKADMKFEIVPRREWVDLLRKSDPDPVTNPTIKLLSFYERKYDHEDTMGPMRWPLDTALTLSASQSLRMAPAPDDELVSKWVAAWRKTGFLH